MNIWYEAKDVKLIIGSDIAGNFDIGFDDEIPEDMRNELRRFVAWAEENFNFPVTLWVDFEYKHFLRRRDGRAAGYLFHWMDFENYPEFSNPEDIPEIRLPVRTEKWDLEDILFCFVKGISYYFAWICNRNMEEYELDEDEAAEILEMYLKTRE